MMRENNPVESISTLEVWRPNKYLAALLGFFVQPLAMLYVGRPWWALLYLLLPVVVMVAEIVLRAPWLPTFTIVVVVALVCSVHAYLSASHRKGVAQRPWYGRWYGLLLIYLAYFVVLFTLRAFCYEPYRMPSNSMYPGLPAGSYVVVKKLGYGHYGSYGVVLWRRARVAPLERGALVVFDTPENESIQYIKRIIGVPGDKVIFSNRELIINGRKVESEALGDVTCIKDAPQHRCMLVQEQLGSAHYRVAYLEEAALSDFETVVPAKSYFVMGDNRDNSRDSRYWGFVPERNIVGRVVLSIAADTTP